MYSTIVFAQQPQLLSWAIPPNQVNFTGATPVVSPLPTTGGTNPTYYEDLGFNKAFNSMNDKNGNLLFFVAQNDAGQLSVYDKTGTVITDVNGHTELKCDYSYYQLLGGYQNWVTVPGYTANEWAEEISIVPDPGNCNQYYIIAAFRNYYDQGTDGISYYPVYAKLDFSAPSNPHLIATSSTANVVTLATLTGIPYTFGTPATKIFNRFGIAVTPGVQSHLLFISSDGIFYKFKIEASGISYLSSMQPTFSPGIFDNALYSEMEIVQLSNGNYRLAQVFRSHYIYWCDIDPTTLGFISEKYVALAAGKSIEGLEFAPDGKSLYYSYHISTYNNKVGYVQNLSSGTPIATDYTLNQNVGFIEMGYDGKMYFNAGDHLFARTSPLTPATGSWSYNTTPYTVPLTLDFNYLFNYLLPDQMDGFDYRTNNYIFNYTAGTQGASSYTGWANLNQTWTTANNPFGVGAGTPTNPVIIMNSLVIPAGYNITIQGMRFEFAGRTFTPLTSGALVKVLRSTSGVAGGRLTLVSSTFTSAKSCRTGMWEGIEVEGNNLAQGLYYTGKQAWLNVKVSSIVENAYHAVVLAKVTNTFNGEFGYGTTPAVNMAYSGGVVQVSSSSRFRNNYIDVYFPNYDAPTASIDNNVSSFGNCTFETTPTTTTTTTLYDLDPNLNLVNWFHHILTGVKGITYAGVTFQNTNPTNPVYDILLNKRGNGIFSLNSYFIASKIFGTTYRGKFNNLTYGIYAANFGSIKTFNVSECDFNDNYRGIYAGSVNYEKITLCNFKVNRWPMSPPMPTSNDAAYGVYFDFCKGFTVQQNDFSYAGATSPMANSFGVIVNQSNYNRNCGQHDEIYKNTFHNILAGGRAQGYNSENPGAFCYLGAPGTPNNVGFEFLCNNFTSNIDNSNLSVTRSQNLTTKGNIAYQQGYISTSTLSPAGNAFSHTAGAFDFYSQAYLTDVDGLIQYTCHNNSLTIPATIVSPPIYNYVTTGSGSTYDPTLSCPSKMGPKSPIIIRTEIKSYEVKVAQLEAKIDGGNTTALLQQIYSTASAGNLKNLLMANSPYLSDRVLIAAITRPVALPPGHIKDIVCANSPVTTDVMDALNTVSLPTGILNQINAVQTGVSGRGKLESEIAYYTSQRAYNIDELIRTFSNDTLLDYGVDSILTVFKTYNIQQNKTDLIMAYLTKGDITKATLVNDSLKNAGTDASFTKMMDVAISLKQAPQQESNLLTDAALKSKVDELAVSPDSKEYPSANAVLKYIFNYIYHEYIEPVSWQAQNHSMMQIVSTDEENLPGTQLYPNPSNGVSNFSYTLQEGETGELQIVDVAGKLIKSYQLSTTDNVLNINNTELNAGTYLYKYLVDGFVSKTDKLIIIK